MRINWGVMVGFVLLGLSACGGGGGSDSGGSDSGSTTAPVYTVGGTVAGLAGSGLVLGVNGGASVEVTSNGSFSFSQTLANGSTYNVTVVTQPTNPSQTCSVSNGSGRVSGANVNVSVVCATNSYSISGSVRGLLGSGLVIGNNGANAVAISADGAFRFSAAVVSGANYSVTAMTQPANPRQVCTVNNGNGIMGDNDVTDVDIVCSANTYTVGGMVTGLIGSVVLHNSDGEDATVTNAGAFAFNTPIADGSSYNVTVKSPPTYPAQTCAVSHGSGMVNGGNVADVAVTCTTNTYPITATVSGLMGSGLIIRDNNTDELTITSNGTQQFALPVASAANYNVTVVGQPSNPTQTCVVSNGSGLVVGDAVNVAILCTTNSYTIAGTVTGLAGAGLVVTNNAQEDKAIESNGNFVFSNRILSGSKYDVTIAKQPTNPNQVCEVSHGSGVVSAIGINTVSIDCAAVPCIDNQGTISRNTPTLLASNCSLRMSSYAWSLTPPSGSAAVLSAGNTANASFQADRSGNYGVSLTDSTGKSAAVTLSAPYKAPTAKSSTISMTPGTTFVSISSLTDVDPGDPSYPNDPDHVKEIQIQSVTLKGCIIGSPRDTSCHPTSSTETPGFTATLANKKVVSCQQLRSIWVCSPVLQKAIKIEAAENTVTSSNSYYSIAFTLSDGDDDTSAGAEVNVSVNSGFALQSQQLFSDPVATARTATNDASYKSQPYKLDLNGYVSADVNASSSTVVTSVTFKITPITRLDPRPANAAEAGGFSASAGGEFHDSYVGSFMLGTNDINAVVYYLPPKGAISLSVGGKQVANDDKFNLEVCGNGATTNCQSAELVMRVQGTASFSKVLNSGSFGGLRARCGGCHYKELVIQDENKCDRANPNYDLAKDDWSLYCTFTKDDALKESDVNNTKFVVPGDTTHSLLYWKPQGQYSHNGNGSKPLDPLVNDPTVAASNNALLDEIKTWIEEGAYFTEGDLSQQSCPVPPSQPSCPPP